MSETVSRCLVYCRLRPTNAKDFEDGGYQLVSLDKKRLAVKDERHYDFDGTFGADSRQDDVFNSIAVPCLNHAVNGFCSALMCYGQTGTGKSFTMCCTKPGLEGIIPRSARYLFELIERDKSKAYTVTGQFIQIYRDQLGDLMTDGGRDKVDIHFDKDTGVTLTGCAAHILTSEKDFMNFYDSGNSRRVVTATAMNPESSRGHSAMIVIIESKNPNDETGPKMKGKITFIDLAGYERFSKTGISNSNPIMKDEAKTINASLLSLGHVVSALSNGDKHIPWRNAKLTRLLQDSIGGRSRTSIILTIGPSSESFHETTNSLQFGQRAMAVKVTAKVNVSTDYEKLAARLQSLLDERDERINLLEIQVRSRDAERSEVAERHQRDEEELRERFRQEMEELKSKGGSIDQLRKVEDVFQVEVENLKEQQLEEVQYQEEAHNKQIVTLAAEQQRRERKKQAELQVAQERIIAEFEKKMNSLGGNEDLVNALKQLSEKDALLATRAASIADLQEQVTELNTLLKNAGLTVPTFEPLEETFIDLSQLEEIQSRLEGEIDHHKNITVSLRAQLEATNEQLDARANEVSKLHCDIGRLQKQLDEAGIDEDGAASPLVAPRGLVDVESLETLKMLMQEEIDTLKIANKTLQDELEKSLLVAESSHTVGQPETPRIGRARALSRVDAGRNMARRADAGEHERKALQEKLAESDKRLVCLSREYNLALQRADVLEDRCNQHNVPLGDTVLPDATAGVAIMEALHSAKEAEIQHLLEIVRKHESSLFTETQYRQQLEDHISLLSSALKLANIDAPLFSPSMRSIHEVQRVSMETLMGFVHDVRAATTKLCSIPINCTDSKAKEIFTEQLESRDCMLQLRENVIIDKELLVGKLSSLVSSLKSRLEGLGESVALSEDVQSALSAAELLQSSAVAIATQQIEEDLRRQKEEKERLQGVLNAMSAERTKEAQFVATAKVELERHAAQSSALELSVLQQRQALETASVDSQSLMGIVVDLRQQLIDKESELQNIASELMRLQAEKGVQESEGFMAAVKRKWTN